MFMALAQAFVRGQMYATLHTLLLIILFLCSGLSLAVFGVSFVWTPFLVSAFCFASSDVVELREVVPGWVTTTQFPSPAGVANATRQNFSVLPPAHLMFSDNSMVSSCEP